MKAVPLPVLYIHSLSYRLSGQLRPHQIIRSLMCVLPPYEAKLCSDKRELDAVRSEGLRQLTSSQDASRINLS